MSRYVCSAGTRPHPRAHQAPPTTRSRKPLNAVARARTQESTRRAGRVGWGRTSCTFSARVSDGRRRLTEKVERRAPPDPPTQEAMVAIVTPMADRTFAKFTFLQDRSRLAPPRRRAARRRQAGVPRRLRGLRPRPLAARLLNHRNARRRRPRPAQPEPDLDDLHTFHVVLGQSGLAKWADDALLVPLDDQALALLRGAGAAGDLRLRAQVPLPLPDGQAAPLVRAARRGAAADHEEPHRGRPPLPRDHDQHHLLLRPRRPGVRRRLRGRRPGRCSSTWSTSCARPSRASTPSARRRSSPASRCGSARRSTRSTAPPTAPRARLGSASRARAARSLSFRVPE